MNGGCLTEFLGAGARETNESGEEAPKSAGPEKLLQGDHNNPVSRRADVSHYTTHRATGFGNKISRLFFYLETTLYSHPWQIVLEPGS